MRRILMAVVLTGTLPLLALADASESSRRVEEKKREILDEAPSRLLRTVDSFSLETGGWINYRYSDYKNSDNDKSEEDALRNSSWGDLRLWGRLVYQTPEMAQEKRRHFLYLRFKDVYIRNRGDDPGEKYDNRGPSVNYAYGSFDWDAWKLEAGRRYFNIGRGIAFSGVFDGVQVNYQQPGWNIGLLAAQTKPHDDNIDTSVPGYDKGAARSFAGLGLGYAGIPDHQIYGYALVERDHSRERPEDFAQDYGYDAVFYGAGSKGQWGKRWPYWLEVIQETGTSREDGTNAKSDVKAWAVSAEQRFLTLWRSGLTFSGEYAMGSGDPDRAYVTNTVGGNAAGHDRNFMYFGYLPTGVALSPLLSNLRLARVGVDLYPFFAVPALRKVLLGLDYYRYWKDRPEGGISDYDATETSREVGQEVDVRIDWRLGPRVILSVEGGCFMPGAAYPDTARAREQAASISLSYIF
ncbi:MAG: alginate export family protein [Candidatus Omnitrophica bacterium]|nr:alginate export family protein [Candidatus Omnitrophota bacterium]